MNSKTSKTAPMASEARELPYADIELPPDYRPSPEEPYMNPFHLAYFRRRLLDWKESLMREGQRTIDHLRREGEGRQVGDEADRAAVEAENILELYTRDRYRKLLPKIEAALRRIDDGDYGYCEETGEEIGVLRLDARPIATLCVEAQERHERLEKQFRSEL